MKNKGTSCSAKLFTDSNFEDWQLIAAFHYGMQVAVNELSKLDSDNIYSRILSEWRENESFILVDKK